jgi:mono/diheme cytochrome c family protein
MPSKLPSHLDLLRLVALAWALVGPAAASVAAAEGPTAPDPSEAAKGQVIYKRFCAVCHGAAGAGDGQLASELRAKPVDLTRLAARNGGVFSFDKVARAIDGRETVRAHGSADMPVWGEVFSKTSGTEAADQKEAVARLTHYVWTLQKPGGN